MSRDRVLVQMVKSGQVSADEALLLAGQEAELYNGAVPQDLFNSLSSLGLSEDVRAEWLQGHKDGATFADTQAEDIELLDNKLTNLEEKNMEEVIDLEAAVEAEIVEEHEEENVEEIVKILESAPEAEAIIEVPVVDALEEEMTPFVEAPVLPSEEVAPVLEDAPIE